MNKQEILEEILELKERLSDLKKMYGSLNSPNKRWRAKKINGFSSAYPTKCDIKLFQNVDGTWITIQDNVGTSMTIKLPDIVDFILETYNEPIPYIMHKELDIPLLECQKAYDIAMEYLRKQGKLKG